MATMRPLRPVITWYTLRARRELSRSGRLTGRPARTDSTPGRTSMTCVSTPAARRPANLCSTLERPRHLQELSSRRRTAAVGVERSDQCVNEGAAHGAFQVSTVRMAKALRPLRIRDEGQSVGSLTPKACYRVGGGPGVRTASAYRWILPPRRGPRRHRRRWPIG